ncbi:uncharacterized protein LOC144424347 [Styela clava]
MLQQGLRKSLGTFSRQMSTLRSMNKKPLLANATQNTGRRTMAGHGPDISVAEGIAYIVVGGGGIAAWGVYKTIQMRERIEAFETGKVVQFQSPSDEEFFKYREIFAERYGPEEEE